MKEKKNYSVSVIRDTRSNKGDDAEAPLKLLVNIAGDRFRVGIGLNATATDFSSTMKIKGGAEEVKDLRKKLHDLVQKAEEVLDTLPNPNKAAFLRFFKSDANLSRSKDDVTPWFDEYILSLTEKGSIKYAYCMTLSLRSFKKYKSVINFSDITEQWLRGYEKFMLNGGNTVTTVQIYLKNLRTVWNKAVKDGMISPKNYPFKNYKIGTSVKSNDALYEDDIKKLWQYKARHYKARRNIAYWQWCFLSNGCNFKDLCYLKVKNLKNDDMLMFQREKTKRTTRVSGKEIKVYVNEEMKKILKEYGTKSKDPEAYLFPILEGKKGAVECENYREKVQHYTNTSLKRVGAHIGLRLPLTLNLARHSFSTMLKIKGYSAAIIGEKLGHSSIAVTEHYLHGLRDEDHKQVSENLTSFLR